MDKDASERTTVKRQRLARLDVRDHVRGSRSVHADPPVSRRTIDGDVSDGRTVHDDPADSGRRRKCTCDDSGDQRGECEEGAAHKARIGTPPRSGVPSNEGRLGRTDTPEMGRSAY